MSADVVWIVRVVLLSVHYSYLYEVLTVHLKKGPMLLVQRFCFAQPTPVLPNPKQPWSSIAASGTWICKVVVFSSRCSLFLVYVLLGSNSVQGVFAMLVLAAGGGFQQLP